MTFFLGDFQDLENLRKDDDLFLGDFQDLENLRKDDDLFLGDFQDLENLRKDDDLFFRRFPGSRESEKGSFFEIGAKMTIFGPPAAQLDPSARCAVNLAPRLGVLLIWLKVTAVTAVTAVQIFNISEIYIIT